MKFENLDNLKSEEIMEKEVPEENIEKIVVQDIEKEIEELDAIEKQKEKEGKMSSFKKAIIGISIVLASMMATEAMAGGVSDKEKKEIRGKASDVFEQLDAETEKMREKSSAEIIKEKQVEQAQEKRFETPKKPYSVDELFNYLEKQEKTEKQDEVSGQEIKPEGEKEKMSAEEIEIKKQEIYNLAIEKIKNNIEQERDFSWIKNPSLRRVKESDEKRLRLQYQTILEHPEKVQVKFNPENNTLLFSGTYADPVSGVEQPFDFFYQGVEKGE